MTLGVVTKRPNRSSWFFTTEDGYFVLDGFRIQIHPRKGRPLAGGGALDLEDVVAVATPRSAISAVAELLLLLVTALDSTRDLEVEGLTPAVLLLHSDLCKLFTHVPLLSGSIISSVL